MPGLYIEKEALKQGYTKIYTSGVSTCCEWLLLRRSGPRSGAFTRHQHRAHVRRASPRGLNFVKPVNDVYILWSVTLTLTVRPTSDYDTPTSDTPRMTSGPHLAHTSHICHNSHHTARTKFK